MLNFIDFLAAKVTHLVAQGARSRMSDKEFLEKEIARWKNSPHRIDRKSTRLNSSHL